MTRTIPSGMRAQPVCVESRPEKEIGMVRYLKMEEREREQENGK